jgi:hypothetical protein
METWLKKHEHELAEPGSDQEWGLGTSGKETSANASAGRHLGPHPPFQYQRQKTIPWNYFFRTMLWATRTADVSDRGAAIPADPFNEVRMGNSVVLATEDTEFGQVPAAKAKAEAQALANKEGKVVTLRDPITDRVLGKVKPARTRH